MLIVSFNVRLLLLLLLRFCFIFIAWAYWFCLASPFEVGIHAVHWRDIVYDKESQTPINARLCIQQHLWNISIRIRWLHSYAPFLPACLRVLVYVWCIRFAMLLLLLLDWGNPRFGISLLLHSNRARARALSDDCFIVIILYYFSYSKCIPLQQQHVKQTTVAHNKAKRDNGNKKIKSVLALCLAIVRHFNWIKLNVIFHVANTQRTPPLPHSNHFWM